MNEYGELTNILKMQFLSTRTDHKKQLNNL